MSKKKLLQSKQKESDNRIIKLETQIANLIINFRSDCPELSNCELAYVLSNNLRKVIDSNLEKQVKSELNI